MSADSDPNKWGYPPHTKAKHDMLASYLDGWYPILSKWNGRLLFLDGFAGRGRYVTGEEGSPLIALERLIKHRHFDQMKHRKSVFFFVEADEDNANSLRTELGKYKARHDPWPDCVKFNVLNEHLTRRLVIYCSICANRSEGSRRHLLLSIRLAIAGFRWT